MLGLLGLIILNTKKISDQVKENISFQIILKDDAKEVDVARLQKTLDVSDYAKSNEYVTKEDAAKTLQKDLGEDFINFLGYNPLLSSINVHLRAEYANTDSIGWIEKNLMNNKLVKEVLYQKSLVSMVNENAKKISLIILIFSGLLMVIALALINNTIRLSIYSKRFLIKTMLLVGATQGFIRKPFLLKGIKHGLYSAAIAIALLLTIIYLAEKELPELSTIQDSQMLLLLFALVTLLGVIISGVSTSLAVRKYLRLKTDDLYY